MIRRRLMNILSNNNTQDFYVELVRLRGINSELTLDELSILIKSGQIEYRAFGISEQAALATAKRAFKLGNVLPLPSTLSNGENSGTMTEAEFNDIVNTYASIGFTQKNPGPGGPIPLIISNIIGTGSEDLIPPDSPQQVIGGNYNGFIKVTGLEEISSSGSLSVTNGSFVIGTKGNYYTTHAWVDLSCNINNNNIGFIFGIERNGSINFSPRPTGMRGSNGQDRTNLSGGGFIDNLEVGDTISLWVASEKDTSITIYDGNLGLNLRSKL